MKKIPTLFVRDFEHDNGRYVTSEVTPGCEWVLAGEGTPTRKYDGTCMMLDDNGEWWARREVKRGKAAPPGFQPVDTDETTGKTVGWEPLSQSPFAKFHADALPEDEPGTYELIGPKVNGNPEGFARHSLVPHVHAQAFEDVPRDHDGIRAWLAAHSLFEGIVWHHPDGRMAKIKARDFRR